jgi:hypothetical protein
MGPYNFVCEEHLPAFGISNGVLQVFDGGSNPSQIISIDDSWSVKVDFDITGAMANCIDGDIKIEVLLERMGTGETGLPNSTSLVALNGAGSYTQTMTFPAGSVAVSVDKVIVVLSMISNNGQPCPLACFAIGPMVQFYDPS